MALKDDIISFAQNKVRNLASNLGYQARNAYYQAGQSAWSPQGVLGAPVNAIQSGIKAVSNLKRIELPKATPQQIPNPILRTGANLAVSLPESLVNIPRNYVTGIARTGQELGTAYKEQRPLNLQNLAGGIAPLAESLLDVGTLGGFTVAKGLVKEGAKQGIKQAVLKQGAKGAGIGALGGLTYGLDTQYGKKFNLGEVAQNVAGGGLLGGILGGVAGGAGAVTSKVFQGYKNIGFSDDVAKDLTKKHFISGESILVKPRQPKAQVEFNAKVNSVLGRELNTPVFSDDLKTYINKTGGIPDTQLGAGLSIKKINRDKVLVPKIKMDIAPQMGQAQTLKSKIKVSKPSTMELQDSQIVSKVDSTKPISSQLSISPKGKLNTAKLNLPEEQKMAIDQLQNNVPVTVIGNKDVIKQSVMTKGAKRAITDEQMKIRLAQQLNSRQEVVSLAKQFEKAKQSGASELELIALKNKIIDQSRVAQQEGTQAGRMLQARNILANELATPEQKIYALLDDAGIDPSVYVKDAVNVDFNNPTQVVNFYRKYVPAKFLEIIDEIRYTNMLSSPLTHIINTASNLVQSGPVKIAEKTITGGLDFISSKLTGKERQYFASQGIDYAKGYYSAIPEAFKKFKSIATGKEISLRPDLEFIPADTGKVLKAYTTPLRLLEAADQFFRTLVMSGEKRSLARLKLSETELLKRAQQSADYTLFRQKFDPSGELGQGVVLKMWDKWNSQIQSLRNAPGGKWVVPFLQTPTNILKQGLEYSPLGVTTTIGAKRPLEQLSKAIIGTAVFSAAYAIADRGGSTWSVPTSEKEKELFYASGLQPYSVKIGDKWVSYSKLGPLSYPIAMAAALRWAEKNNPDQNTVSNIGEALGGVLGFFGDQSYVQSIGDVIETIQSASPKRLATGIQKQIANFAGQVVPYRSFMGWVTRMVDPVYRKPEGIVENVISQVPGLSQTVPAYTDLQGQPSKRDLPFVNAVSPVRIGVEKSQYKQLLDVKEQERIDKAVDTRQFEKGGNQAVTSGNVIFYTNENGDRVELKLTELDKIASLPTTNKYETAIKESKQYQKAATILDNPGLNAQQKQQALQALGIDPVKAAYYQVANDNTNKKTMYVLDAINQIATQGGTTQDAVKILMENRQQVNGQMIASNAVLDNLIDEGVISANQAKEIKKYELKDGKAVKMGKTSVKKPKKVSIKIPKLNKIKVKKIKLKKLRVKKFKQVKLKAPKRLKLSKVKL